IFTKSSSKCSDKINTTLKETISEKHIDFYKKEHFVNCEKYIGSIWKAKFEKLNLTVALKSLSSSNNSNFDVTLVEELQTLKRINGFPHIINFYGIAKGEIILQQIDYLSDSNDIKQDIYDLGIILSEVFSDSLPSESLVQCIELYKKCLNQTPDQRPTIKTVYEELMQIEDGGF
ncbi:15350_t:CDS:2, partial [Racocetra fulgida]